MAHPLAWTIAFSVAMVGAGQASSQDYPNKPLRIVTSSAGGGNDFAARLIAPGLASSLGQPVIVDNRGAGIIPGDIVSKAPPDGHTLLCASNPLWILPLMRRTPYDPVRDFSPITIISLAPNILVVHPSLPVKSVKELIALAKARPGHLNYGSAGPGSSNHLAGELFKSMARVDIVHVPYKGQAQALNDLMGGQMHLMFPNAPSAVPHVKSGRLRALAVSTAQPSPLAPGLPTVAASGVPGYESAAIFGIFAPAKMPAALINRLNAEIVRIVTRPEVKERFFNTGVETIGSSPEQLSETIKSEMTRMTTVIKEAGIRAE